MSALWVWSDVIIFLGGLFIGWAARGVFAERPGPGSKRRGLTSGKAGE